MNYRSVKFSSVVEHKKLKSNFYLSKGLIYKEKIESKKYDELSILVDQLSNIGINKRYYVEDKSYGVPFVSNSSLSTYSPLSSCKYVSKILCNKPDKAIVAGMTLISAVGTIGMTAYAGRELQGAMTPIGNLIRVKPKKYSGFIYAFFRSKVGQDLLNQVGSGSVQTYLDPTTCGKIPIPRLEEHLKFEIHSLIEECSILRTEANKILSELGNEFLQLLNINKEQIKKLNHPRESICAKSFVVSRKELDPISIRSRGYSARYKEILSVFEKHNPSSLLDLLVNEPRKGGRYRRVEVSKDSNNAIELLNQGDIHDFMPEGKTISKKYIDDLEEQTSKKNSILIPGVGTLGENEVFGRPVFVKGYLENKVLSEHLVRITPDINKVHPGYLFVVLSSPLFFRILRSIVYGTNLLYFIIPFLNKAPIPRFSHEIENNLGERVYEAQEKLTIALKKEKQAIALIEKEIELWLE
jgi:hypothetical protein